MKYLIGALPIIIFLIIFIFLNRKELNKTKLLEYLFLFILGCIACYTTNKIENKIGGYFPRMADMSAIMVFIYAVLGVSLYEEGFKWFFTLVMTFKEKSSKLSIITYSVICSLGFAFSENIVYYIAYSNLHNAVSRMFTAIPGHVCFAVIMGLLLWYAFHNKGIKRWIYLFLSCFIPIIIHAIYNALIYKGIVDLYLYNFIYLAILEIISIVIMIKSLKE